MLHWLLLSPTVAMAASSGASLNMSNLVTFGDSFTDEGRLGYMFGHNALPPAGQLLPPTNDTSVGGYVWARTVASKTGAKLYDYAVGGAMCSNKVTQHYFSNIDGPFPSVLDYEVPAFKTELSYPELYPDRTSDNTVYTVWIGTNDLGIDGFLGDKQEKGATLADYVGAVWEAFDGIYETGGRQFVLFNVLPLQLSPMYASIENGGTGNNFFWGDKASYNTTEMEEKMAGFVTSVNTMFSAGAASNVVDEKRWPGATLALFDVHALLLDLRSNPSEYYTPPADIKSSWRGCGDSGCFESTEPRSSFMWYDEVHPSERTSKYVAEQFIEVVKGKSKYGTYYQG